MAFFEKLKIVIDFIDLLPPTEVDRCNIAQGTLKLIAGTPIGEIAETDHYVAAALYQIGDIIGEDIEEIKIALEEYIERIS